MFGLKIVKKQDYLDVLEERNLYQREAADKAAQVENLQGVVNYLNNRIAALEQQIATPKKETPVLLEDVAEAPLEVEKPAKKTRKVVKTTEGVKPRKRVTHKSEETE